MTIETIYGNVEIGGPRETECYIFTDWVLETVPEGLQKRIDEIIRSGKQRAFEKRKEKLLQNGYQTLEEFERYCPVRIEKPYIGIQLDTREKELRAALYVNGYDSSGKGIWIEFHHVESLAVDPEVLLELLLYAVKKAAPSEQTLEPEVEEY